MDVVELSTAEIEFGYVGNYTNNDVFAFCEKLGLDGIGITLFICTIKKNFGNFRLGSGRKG